MITRRSKSSVARKDFYDPFEVASKVNLINIIFLFLSLEHSTKRFVVYE